MNPQESRTRACKLAESMGWFMGQGKDGKPCLYRTGHAAERFPTWLSALTELMRLRELLPRGEARPIPVAQHAPPLARAYVPVSEPARYVKTTLATDQLPVAQIVEVDQAGRIIGPGK